MSINEWLEWADVAMTWIATWQKTPEYLRWRVDQEAKRHMRRMWARGFSVPVKFLRPPLLVVPKLDLVSVFEFEHRKWLKRE
ncbi:hypothetical protein COLO4_34036 [Corchorus olitorius]|uniref:Uncharacterized protein n=1 Tax=Corchorus olitorius TaxID=93759 RepID=A0A1R3GP15_9ROSI|nr:hypothetical protein COLO4_34036 [Corchorus olitorius]